MNPDLAPVSRQDTTIPEGAARLQLTAPPSTPTSSEAVPPDYIEKTRVSADGVSGTSITYIDATPSGIVQMRVPRDATPPRSNGAALRNDLERLRDAEERMWDEHASHSLRLSHDYSDIRGDHGRLVGPAGSLLRPGTQRSPTFYWSGDCDSQPGPVTNRSQVPPVTAIPQVDIGWRNGGLLPSSKLGTNRKYRKPAIFEGNTSLQEYLVHFDMVSSYNQWDEQTKGLELAISLRGNALCVPNDLPIAKRGNYNCLVAALKARFEPEDLFEMHRAQLKTRIRKRGEALEDLAQDIKKLVRKSYPTAGLHLTERLSRDHFLDAINDSEMRWSIVQGRAMTVTDAVRLALEYETFQTSVRRGNKPVICRQTEVDEYRVQELAGRIARVENQASKVIFPGNQYHNKARKSYLVCYFCQQEGHKKPDCPLLKNAFQGQGQTTGRKSMTSSIGTQTSGYQQGN